MLRVHAASLAEKAEVAFRPGPTVLATLGDTLLRIAEANHVALESGCRMGMCGADPVRVLAGEDNLSPPTGAERATLRRLSLAPGCRMACTARVRGPVKIAPILEPAAAPQAAQPPEPAPALPATPDLRRVVVIGTGVAGVTAAVELRKVHPDVEITILGFEIYDFYNRMTINNLVSESTSIDKLYLLPRDWASSRRIRYLRGVGARSIEREGRRVITEEGEALPYDRLILAAGARCYVPPTEGFGMAGSFVLRTIDDGVAMQQHIRRRRCRTAVVVGGGLLGLETAYSMTQLDVRVFVLDRAPWPLSRQLDEQGGALLWQMMDDLGITILPQTQARRLHGGERVQGVETLDGRTLDAQTCLVATGIQPDVALATAAGLEVGRGVVVDDHLRTSDPRIYAVGDIVEHGEHVYGLWTAGVEQARVAVVSMLGGEARFNGIVPPTRLKVAGIDLLSAGDIGRAGDDIVELRVEDGNARRYRKLLLRGGRVRGGIVIGHPDLFDSVSAAVERNQDVRPVLPALERGDWSALGE